MCKCNGINLQLQARLSERYLTRAGLIQHKLTVSECGPFTRIKSNIYATTIPRDYLRRIEIRSDGVFLNVYRGIMRVVTSDKTNRVLIYKNFISSVY
jgi:hypothetical protein